jgi:hypothetical protein
LVEHANYYTWSSTLTITPPERFEPNTEFSILKGFVYNKISSRIFKFFDSNFHLGFLIVLQINHIISRFSFMSNITRIFRRFLPLKLKFSDYKYVAMAKWIYVLFFARLSHSCTLYLPKSKNRIVIYRSFISDLCVFCVYFVRNNFTKWFLLHVQLLNEILHVRDNSCLIF